jgi:hypothetical protein
MRSGTLLVGFFIDAVERCNGKVMRRRELSTETLAGSEGCCRNDAMWFVGSSLNLPFAHQLDGGLRMGHEGHGQVFARVPY